MDPVKYERYLGHSIRSSPRKADDKWAIQIDITFPNVGMSQLTREYLDETRLFQILEEAHIAGFEYGRRIINGVISPQH